MDKPLLSVIVCTYNRAGLLDNCLTGLCAQEIDNNLYEVIVVDNNSKDDTFGVVSKYIKKNENIRYVTEKSQGLSYARNRGCEEARSEHLVYIDDDAIAPPAYLSNILEVINRYAPDILGGPVYPYYTEKKPHWFRDKYEIKKYEEMSGFSKTCRVTGANYIIKKTILEQLGMFDTELGMKGDEIGIGEERKVLETYRKKTANAGQKVYYSLECHIKHHIPQYKMKIRYFMMRHYISGKMMSRLDNKRYKAINLVLLVVKLPLKFVWRTSKELIRHGPIGADYIEVCRWTFFDTGMIIGTLKQVLMKEKSLLYRSVQK